MAGLCCSLTNNEFHLLVYTRDNVTISHWQGCCHSNVAVAVAVRVAFKIFRQSVSLRKIGHLNVRLWTEHCASIPDRVRDFSQHYCPDWLWVSHILLFIDVRGLFSLHIEKVQQITQLLYSSDFMISWNFTAYSLWWFKWREKFLTLLL